MTKFINKKSCYIGKDVTIGKNVTIYENKRLEGNTQISDNVTLLPNNYIKDSFIGEGTIIHSSVIEESMVEERVKIGPFAHLRPNSTIKADCKIGNFVEIKNSSIGTGSKVSHLAYVGDAKIGKGCNIGCGVIFANYDGKKKNKTVVGNHVFIGSNSNIIAPVVIESESYICAGTTVTKDVNNGDFVIGRVRQENKNNRAIDYWQASTSQILKNKKEK